MCPDPEARRGAVLLLVLGIAAILFSLVVTFIVWMRNDSEEAQAMVQEAQARLVLHGALMFIQESSRIGWSDEGREMSKASPASPAQSSSGFREAASPDAGLPPIAVAAVVDRGGEAFGWTDQRNGWLGPLGPRDPASGAIPVPHWWRIYSDASLAPTPKPKGWPSASWPSYRPLPDESQSGQFPRASLRRWPLPGAATRCLLAPCVLPPYAITQDAVMNPLVPVRGVAGGPAVEISPTDPSWDDDWGGAFNTNDPWLQAGSAAGYGYHGVRGYFGMLDPQPVKSRWADFKAGEQEAAFNPADAYYQPELQWKMQAGSAGRSWMRIYRELQSDHDGDGRVTSYQSSGEVQVDWMHDNVALSNAAAPQFRDYSVFIIACGSGASRGYRFWSLSADDPRRALEVVTAQESGLFPGQDMFESLRSQERILWYRVEWSPRIGGALDGRNYTKNDSYTELDNRLKLGGDWDWPGARGMTIMSFGGNFLWVQRLDREPPKW